MKKVIKWKNKTAKEQFLKGLMDNGKKVPMSYDKVHNHQVGDYINHSKFGCGFIQKVINHTKIEVFFEDSERVMLQNWQ